MVVFPLFALFGQTSVKLFGLLGMVIECVYQVHVCSCGVFAPNHQLVRGVVRVRKTEDIYQVFSFPFRSL